jgi:hypothetical protein
MQQAYSVNVDLLLSIVAYSAESALLAYNDAELQFSQ